MSPIRKVLRIPQKARTPLASLFFGLLTLAVAIVVVVTPVILVQNAQKQTAIDKLNQQEVALLQQHSKTFALQKEQALANAKANGALIVYAKYLDMTNAAICRAVHADCPAVPK